MKNFFRDLPLKLKLLGYTAVMLLLITLSFGYATYSLAKIGEELTTIVEEDIPLTKLISLMTVTQLEQAVSFERSLHYGSKLNDKHGQEKFKTTISHFDHGTKVIENAITKAIAFTQHAQSSNDIALINKFAEVKKQLKQIEHDHDSYVEHVHQTFALLAKGKDDAAAADILIEKVVEEEETLDKTSEALLLNIQSFTQDSAIAAQTHEKQAITTLLIIGVFSLVVGTILSLLLSRFIVTGINTAIVTASGDLTQEITVTSKDEVGQLLSAMKAMRDKLRTMIGDITSVTGQLSSASQVMSEVTSQTSLIIDQQRNETQLVSSAMDQMTSTSREVSDIITQTANHAVEATNQTVEGRQIVDTAVAEINKLSDQIDLASVTIEQLEQHSGRINSVMDVIKGIAEQTNLLALNAAIEAARAGEQGRGFAVVADEVRTLAVRTQESTKEINSMIEKLQIGTSDAVTMMQKSRNQTNTAVECAKKSGEAFTLISASVNQISTMCEKIAIAATDQGIVSEQISKNIIDINEMSSQTAIGAQETSTASDDLAVMSSKLKVLVNNFAV
ncbi:MAG: methyl-accepting chemotaxis protein [Gammaproteobacteria bacterium]|nr:methyl-accepting chemotaxis protein [Gammaproteobacteria bacterium]